MNLATWLAAIAGPIAWRVMAALGLGVVSMVGISEALELGLSTAQTYWGQFGGTAAELVALSGVGGAIGILAGAITARASLIMLKRFVIK